MKIQIKGLMLAATAGLMLNSSLALAYELDSFSKKAVGIYAVDQKCLDLNNNYNKLVTPGSPSLDPNDLKESVVVIYPAIYHNFVGLAVKGLKFSFPINVSPGTTYEFFYSSGKGLRAQRDQVDLKADFAINNIVGEYDAVHNRSSGMSVAGFSSPFFKNRTRSLVANRDATYTLTLPMGWSETAPNNPEITCTLTRKAGEPQDLDGIITRLAKVDNAARFYSGILDFSNEQVKDPAEETDPAKIAHIKLVNRLFREMIPEPLRTNTLWSEINYPGISDYTKQGRLRLKRMYGAPDTEQDPWAERSY